MHNLKSLYKGGLGGHVCVQCRRYASVKGKTHYEILGVSRTASDKEIRSAYIELSKKHHPDTAGSKSKKKFTDISEAYSVLSKPLTRKEYDNKLTMDSMGQSSSNRYGPYSRPPGSGPASYPGGPQYEQYGRYNQYGQRENFYRPEGSPYSEYERKREEMLRKARQKMYAERLRQYREFEESVYRVQKTGQQKFNQFFSYYLSFLFMSSIFVAYYGLSSLKTPRDSGKLHRIYLFTRKYSAEIFHSVIITGVGLIGLLGLYIYKQHLRDFYEKERAKQAHIEKLLLSKVPLLLTVYCIVWIIVLLVGVPLADKQSRDEAEGRLIDELYRTRWENSELRRRYEYFYGREGQQNRRRANASRAEFKSQEEQGKELTRIITFAMIFALVVTLLRIFPIKSMILQPNFGFHSKRSQNRGSSLALPYLFFLLYLSTLFVWKKASWHHTDIKKLDRQRLMEKNQSDESSRSDLRRSPSDEMKENMIKGPDLREKDISPPRF